MSSDTAQDWLPLTEASYCILLALAEPNHGYGIMQDVERFSDGGVQLGAGTLYTALAKFEKRKLIERIGDGGRQKRYQLTETGRELLALEIKRLASLAALGRKRFPGGRT
ncbi:MAG: PadR family transcriptional regulator [Pseudomonadota bacterium]